MKRVRDRDERFRNLTRPARPGSLRVPSEFREFSDPPFGFGISTARTGGGKYDHGDIRFQILYRFSLRSLLELLDDCPSTPAAPLIRLDPLIRLPDRPLRDIKRLNLRIDSPTWLLPGPVRLPTNEPGRPAPFAPLPLQELHRYYGVVRPPVRHQYSTPYSSCCSGYSLSPPPPPRRRPDRRGARSHVSCQRRRSGSRRLRAGHRQASTRAPPALPGDLHYTPVSMPSALFFDTS